MREIKFRGKRLYEKKDWKYGFYFLYKDAKGKEFHNIINNKEMVIIDEFGSEVPAFTNVDKNTVGQFTGLKDKDGKEVYEGDIIDFSYDMFVGNFNTFVAKGIIIFEEGAFYVQCLENENLTKDESYLIYTINIDTIEVIRKYI